MGIFDRFGRGAGSQRDPVTIDQTADEQAIARYRYMLKTAPPETIEQAHAEAFAQLTPEQRRKVLQDLSTDMPDAERASAARVDDSPGALARLATRSEIRRPGAIERALGGGMPAMGAAAGPGLGGMFLASMAGTVLGSVVAQHFFANHPEAHQLFGDSEHVPTDSNQTAADADQATTDDSDNFADASDMDTDIASGVDSWDV